MELIEIVKPFIYSEDTCDAVIEYFKNGNEPKGPYVNLSQYFINKNYDKHTKADEAYRKWLEELVETEREGESIIVDCLRKKYQNKECLYRFVFLLNKMDSKLNQKWHFFIGYWGYREYITKYPETNTDKLSPLKNSNEARSRNPFVQCPEGTIWYEYMQNNNFLGRKDNAERNRHV